MPSILILDDNPTCRAYLQRVVRAAGFENVAVAEQPSSAMAACKAWQPDVVLADFQMAEMNGVTFIRELSGHPQTRDIVCALVSARPATELKRDAYAAGALDVLTKPITAAELRIKLRQLSAESDRRRLAGPKANTMQDGWQPLKVPVHAGPREGRLARVGAYALAMGQRLGLSPGEHAALGDLVVKGLARPAADADTAAHAGPLPVSVRIAAVADAFDRMTAIGSGDLTWLVLRASEVIEADSGHRYDPQVVQAFQAVLPQLIDIRRRHPETRTTALQPSAVAGHPWLGGP